MSCSVLAMSVVVRCMCVCVTQVVDNPVVVVVTRAVFSWRHNWSVYVFLHLFVCVLCCVCTRQVWNRLYAESQTNADVHKLWAELKKREEVEGCTFKPTVRVGE